MPISLLRIASIGDFIYSSHFWRAHADYQNVACRGNTKELAQKKRHSVKSGVGWKKVSRLT
jgi:hypothetical protein